MAQGESRRQLGASVKGEWAGGTSAKFTTNRRNLRPPEPEDQPHPLYSMGGRRHFDAGAGHQPEWKPSVKSFPNKEDPRPDKKQGVKYIPPNQNAEPSKGRPERRHAETGGGVPKSYEDDLKGKACFIHLDNRKSVNEYPVEAKMGSKQRVQTLYEARNGCPMASLGDKVYKAPEYQTSFFNDGGLIAGST